MLRRICAPLVLVLAVIVLAAGCGGSGGSTTPPPTQPATRPTTPPTGKTTVSVFFLKGGAVSQVTREVASSSVQAALAELLNGPTASEKNQGYATAIPAGTKLKSYTVAGSKATADFSSEMLNFGGGSAMVQAITSQIDNTVVSNDKAVKSVVITIDGKPADEVLQP